MVGPERNDQLCEIVISSRMRLEIAFVMFAVVLRIEEVMISALDSQEDNPNTNAAIGTRIHSACQIDPLSSQRLRPRSSRASGYPLLEASHSRPTSRPSSEQPISPW
jgi:hypothetical protein